MHIFNDAQEKELIEEGNVKNTKLEYLMGIGGLALLISVALLTISKSEILLTFMIILMF